MSAAAVDRVLGSGALGAPRFVVTCEGWTAGIGFSRLAGFSSEVEFQEYSANGRSGHLHTKQFGRAKAPAIVLERALDRTGFGRLYGWHLLARSNNPLAKLPAAFDILAKNGDPVLACLLENAWCAKLELDAVQADAPSVLLMRATLVCDAILQV